ncbi:hypothetical protein FOCG_08771 [Fusarium oxysporum f. sp. radicis-lycopersici 26381]|uniref:Uncharacterized protein n=2 Tax=Fusarium oxysporum TaxID=5507 RepID=W9I9E9_FUSOX|nr:hypothetical protein FOYG_10357 [Fusarium oxysporum NRRL 32931]EWZ38939.1 hypothetical protein FOZG_08179 [Fusarium oxysporum Fo47]EXL50487.1 hypothetical protein FOCG_08771 [Fusarium oxysporum f. sp. radicis-lycopersici 26381]
MAPRKKTSAELDQELREKLEVFSGSYQQDIYGQNIFVLVL